jgi:MarR family 2-MHQ and catechol resistance regulon transcriptional repressor
VAERTSTPVSDAGLTVGQFGVLETLYHLGPMLASQLAAKHLKSRNNLTTVIDNLEKSGLVRRERVEEDRRAILVHLTEAGRAMIQDLFPMYAQGLAADMQMLSPAEQNQLSDLLRRLGRGSAPR